VGPQVRMKQLGGLDRAMAVPAAPHDQGALVRWPQMSFPYLVNPAVMPLTSCLRATT